MQPCYLIDPQRQSLRLEIKAMRDVKKLLFEQRPGVRSLLLPTIYHGDFRYSTMMRRLTRHTKHSLPIIVWMRNMSGWQPIVSRITFTRWKYAPRSSATPKSIHPAIFLKRWGTVRNIVSKMNYALVWKGFCSEISATQSMAFPSWK